MNWEADSCGYKEPCSRWGEIAESICRGEGWQEGDVAFCQITLDTCLVQNLLSRGSIYEKILGLNPKFSLSFS